MRLLQKKVMLPMAAVAAVAAAGFGASQVSAATSPTGTHQTLAQVIASDFHLDQSKVQSVINQYRSGNQAGAEARYQQMLASAVSNGKITQAQESAILTEHNTLLEQETAAAAQTGSARRTAMQQVRADAKTWATQNNVPAYYLLGARPLRGGMRRDMGANPSPTASPSPTPSVSPSA